MSRATSATKPSLTTDVAEYPATSRRTRKASAKIAPEPAVVGPASEPAPKPAPTTSLKVAQKPSSKPLPNVASVAGPSKSDQILKLLQRKKGATIADLQEATGWQAHSVRGFLSGTVKKRMGVAVKSEMSGPSGRRYTIAET